MAIPDHKFQKVIRSINAIDNSIINKNWHIHYSLLSHCIYPEKKRVNQSLMWVYWSIYAPEISVIVHDAIINDNQITSLAKGAWY